MMHGGNSLTHCLGFDMLLLHLLPGADMSFSQLVMSLVWHCRSHKGAH